MNKTNDERLTNPKIFNIIRKKLNPLIIKIREVPYIAAASYALSFVLLVFRNNIFDIPLGEVFAPLVISLLLVHVSYLLFLLFIDDKNTAAIITFLLTLFMVQFELIFVKSASFLKRIFPIKSSYDVAIVVILTLATFVLLSILGRFLSKRKELVATLKKFLDISLGVYFLVTVISVIFLLVVNYKIYTFKPDINVGEPVAKATIRPDIYYFVFDRYGSNQTLSEYYDFPNTDFMKEMKSRGFVFNNVEYSNYPYTATSLSSTLNMDYLDKYVGHLPPKYSEVVYDQLIDNGQSLATLKQAGYEYHHVGSWWGATRTSNSADVSYTGPFKIRFLGFEFVVSNFQDELLRSHIIRRVLAADLPIFSRFVHYEQPTQRQIVKYQLSSAQQIVDGSGSEDVFAYFHILSPHPQYVFEADGSEPTYHQDANYGDIPEKIKYINQLKYVNSQIISTVDYILENSDTPPIIIFQPDEGPYRYKDIDDDSLSRADKMQWKYGVTSAFYFPGLRQNSLELSPVNIFPFVFNNYLSEQIEYQPNNNYWYDNKNPYDFTNITELINSPE